MTSVSAQDFTKTHYCKAQGCTNEASSPVGRYSYCKEHQGTARPATTSSNGSKASVVGAEKALRDLLSLAKRVDKAKAKADTLRRKANEADRSADSLEDEYRTALSAATRAAA